jgi:hypothetical protein
MTHPNQGQFDLALAALQNAERDWQRADHPGARKCRPEDIEDFGMPRVLDWHRKLAETEKRYREAASRLRALGAIEPVQFDETGAPVLKEGDLIVEEENPSIYRFKEYNPRSYVATTSLPGFAVALTGVAADRDVRMMLVEFRKRCDAGSMKKLMRPR